MKYLWILFLVTSAWGQDPRSERAITFFKEVAREIVSDDLRLTLENGQILAVEKELVDNTGSLVDALGVPGKVTLSTERWLTFMREGRDVRLLVLHEVLRMAGINDDNYRVSRGILPIESMTFESRPYCDLRVSVTKMAERTKKVTGVGYITPTNGALLITRQSQQKIIENAHEDIAEKCQKMGYHDGYRVRGGGGFSMTSSSVNGFNRAKQTMSLNGECIKNVSVKRAKKEQKKEGCHKAALCKELLSEGILAPLHLEDEKELEIVMRKWRCQ